ncbi:Calcineurin-like phosphoesterase [Stigmatella aurantiaca]|uniref:Calcineurin-like phosphoesterase n=1 Tax=Stigmatella aurantiaca TaxID=41 RepID=A0A1H8BK94_STIAU|nr:metallophosphoesterase [Stigmatella aurantiaca]SEM83310.1 Calcineurin-like phosphoesterase [Stigmatella aurantiaca]
MSAWVPMTRTLCVLMLASLLGAAAPARPEKAAEDTFSGVERVVAVGDVHGDVEALKEVLRFAGLLDAKGHWSGGKAHLVQTGDIADRGAGTREAFELLMRLEREALAAGGRVHLLLGNHEVMNMRGDLRYVTPEELASFADQSATPDAPGAPKGLAGHQAAYGLEGRYGRWLRTHPAVVRIDGTLFLHGGLHPEVPAKTLGELNRWTRQELFPGGAPGGGTDPRGPLWFRGYAREDEAVWGPGLEAVLTRFGARRMVMGHTPTQDGRIGVRFGGRAVLIDTGLSTYYGRHLAALEIRGERLTALYPEGRVSLLVPAAKPEVAPPAPGKAAPGR